MRTIFFLCIVSLMVLNSSCSYKQNQLLFQKNNIAMPNPSVESAPTDGESYHIKPQDVLHIRNLQDINYIVNEVPTDKGTGGGSGSEGQNFQVEDDGTVALPVIGHVAIAGLTRIEATKKIEDLYRKNLLKNPIIELKIVNLKVTILGEINQQGNFPLLKDRTTLVEIIGEAGGLTANANEKNIKIIRGTATNKKVTEIDLSNINSITDPNAILQNGDIIYIAQNKRAVRTDKLRDINTFIQPGLIILNTAVLIFTLSRL
ncbi:polysaccharide biosynthesis/export family protein [Mucilaginibacter segetis]|uniref:Polysaccharide biosynthesis/export family protein n=1 Tax=Mucilaginibacter segetis TaxID=2793071 RepID=A0A934ULR1_9SPHI|nr:polysaccharide biosynthesis/export family protein [Mucilaginibacter segetis]MBK0378220.1 polysaccharide biosynthesis/export family protein [Mucilaginibacter segetis]